MTGTIVRQPAAAPSFIRLRYPATWGFALVVVSLILFLELAKCFGKGAGFGIGLWLLGFIFFPILGFGDAKYLGPQKA